MQNAGYSATFMTFFPTLVLIAASTYTKSSALKSDASLAKCTNFMNPRIIFGCFRTNRSASNVPTELIIVMLGESTFLMGSEPPTAIPGDGEAPLRLETISNPFWIDTTEVTVEKFARFVKATKYVTAAEIFNNSYTFWMDADKKLTNEEIQELRNTRGPWWWISKEGISWRHSSKLYEAHGKGRRQLPVNHVSWDDAMAYCGWAGGRLPTEIEWEYACRGGLEDALYPWGNELKPNGSHMTNIWQGAFPLKNTKKDGYVLRAPVKSFPSNGYGIHELSGNVWEWVGGQGSWLKSTEHYTKDVRVQKGGSYLCHKKHCYRYRCSARTKASRDSTSSNVGFRCVYDVTVAESFSSNMQQCEA
ncbi:unnamed protein product [Orchesella dallaii]|uniref:Sulfatase-modifying factor enzyme-like domain-containing protein n=1 Tax=Orchesella dallaii TaxID=48710 RepID=A0ABP1PS25_9HEXA